MQASLVVANSSGAGLILIGASVIERMSRYRQVGSTDYEAGGVLLGSLRGPHLEVSGCTEPFSEDKRSRMLFDRRDPRHVIAVRTSMSESRGTIGYIGEWHTHPERSPRPSGLDQTNWRSLLSQAGHRLVFVIIGTSIETPFIQSLE